MGGYRSEKSHVTETVLAWVKDTIVAYIMPALGAMYRAMNLARPGYSMLLTNPRRC